MENARVKEIPAVRIKQILSVPTPPPTELHVIIPAPVLIPYLGEMGLYLTLPHKAKEGLQSEDPMIQEQTLKQVLEQIYIAYNKLRVEVCDFTTQSEE
jgi:hypothetical protein